VSPLMAITYRQSRSRGMSAMAPGSDIPAAMSAFDLISSALPPGSDVADSLGLRGVLTLSGLEVTGHEFLESTLAARCFPG